MIRVLVWNEFVHEKEQENVKNTLNYQKILKNICELW